MDPLRDLIDRLADRGTADDYDQPALALDLGVQWSASDARVQGERVASGLARRAPPSLLRVVREYGPVHLHESVIEGAIGMHWPHVPLDRIGNLESYDQPDIGDVPWIGERRVRGVVVRARWDDPQVIGCMDLSDSDEPIWLLYAPHDPTGPGNQLMPLAASYDAVLLVHLTGVDLVLTIGARPFDRALEQLGRVEPELAPFVMRALDLVDRTAAAFSDRADVRMRNSDAPDARLPGLDEGAARVRSRVLRMRGALANL